MSFLFLKVKFLAEEIPSKHNYFYKREIRRKDINIQDLRLTISDVGHSVSLNYILKKTKIWGIHRLTDKDEYTDVQADIQIDSNMIS
jgi:hypothetical protein